MKPVRSKPAPEFSRRIEVSRLGAREAIFPIAATSGERQALARRFDLLALDRLEGEVRLSRLAGGLIRLSAIFAAEVVQACVVSLEPVASDLNERFTVLYGPSAPDSSGVVDLESDIIESFEDGAIDIGEAVAQQLALVLSPYPRAPGVGLAGGETAGGGL